MTHACICTATSTACSRAQSYLLQEAFFSQRLGCRTQAILVPGGAVASWPMTPPKTRARKLVRFTYDCKRKGAGKGLVHPPAAVVESDSPGNLHTRPTSPSLHRWAGLESLASLVSLLRHSVWGEHRHARPLVLRARATSQATWICCRSVARRAPGRVQERERVGWVLCAGAAVVVGGRHECGAERRACVTVSAGAARASRTAALAEPQAG